MLELIEANHVQASHNKLLNDMVGMQGRAMDLFENPVGRRAFDLSAEPSAVVERYGRHRSGLACLLARRLVEAGVPLITVIWNHSGRGQDRLPDDPEAQGWDTHNDLFEVMRRHLLPRFDQTFSALLEDLQQRNLLDQTLVLCLGEFGRAPRVALESNFAAPCRAESIGPTSIRWSQPVQGFRGVPFWGRPTNLQRIQPQNVMAHGTCMPQWLQHLGWIQQWNITTASPARSA